MTITEWHEHQATQFLAWHRKRGGAWDDDFGAWAASKDLGPADRMAIRSIVLAELVAEADAVVTDPALLPDRRAS